MLTYRGKINLTILHIKCYYSKMRRTGPNPRSSWGPTARKSHQIGGSRGVGEIVLLDADGKENSAAPPIRLCGADNKMRSERKNLLFDQLQKFLELVS